MTDTIISRLEEGTFEFLGRDVAAVFWNYDGPDVTYGALFYWDRRSQSEGFLLSKQAYLAARDALREAADGTS